MPRPACFLLLFVPLLTGCCLFPDTVCKYAVHNPFPQLHKVAVVPFFNQSSEPTVDGDLVARAYYRELQRIPGFEVVPLEVTRQVIASRGFSLTSDAEFRHLAEILKVDAVVAGSVTDFSPYYPPRMGLAVAWHAADPAFQAIPPGYGLGDEQGCQSVPLRTEVEAKFAAARGSMTRETSAPVESPQSPPQPAFATQAQHAQGSPPNLLHFPPMPPNELPNVPDVHIPLDAQSEPVLTHVRMYYGDDPDFRAAMADYYQFREVPAAGGFEMHLQRSDDFISFCCRQHIAEMLSARGGRMKTKVLWRWCFGR